MKKNYILKVIPIQPLPPHSPDFFIYYSQDYIKSGSLVKIEFNKKKTIGYVIKCLPFKELKYFIKNLNFNIKSTEGILDENDYFLNYQKKLAYWISRSYYTSLAFACYLFLKNNIKLKITDESYNINKFKNSYKEILLKDENIYLLTKELPKPIFIIAPDQLYAENIYEKYKNKIENLIFLNKRTQIDKLFKKTIFENKYIYLTWKTSIFLPLLNIKSIIVLDEGNIFYKEFFKQPNLNYLDIIKKTAKILSLNVVYISKLPTLKSITKFKPIIEKINFNKIETLEELKQIIYENKITKIYVPHKSLAYKLYCLNCNYEAICNKCNNLLTVLDKYLFCRFCHKLYELNHVCPKCKKEELSVKGWGGLWLKKYLDHLNIKSYYIQTKNDLEKLIKRNNIYDYKVIIGSWYLLKIYHHTEASVFINFDKSFYNNEHINKEISIRIAHFLYHSSNQLFIHTKLDEKSLEKIKNGNILKEIILERKEKKLPPFWNNIKILSSLKNLEDLKRRLIYIKNSLEKRLFLSNKKFFLYGPFLDRIYKNKNRYQAFILLKVPYNTNLKKLLDDIKYIEKIEIENISF